MVPIDDQNYISWLSWTHFRDHPHMWGTPLASYPPGFLSVPALKNLFPSRLQGGSGLRHSSGADGEDTKKTCRKKGTTSDEDTHGSPSKWANKDGKKAEHDTTEGNEPVHGATLVEQLLHVLFLHRRQASSQRHVYLEPEDACVCNNLHYSYNVNGYLFYNMLLLFEEITSCQASSVPHM